MELSYYPGCSLHGLAGEYDDSVRAVFRTMDVELCELADWSCCGSTSAHVTDHDLAISLAARNLAIADRRQQEMLVPCPSCFSRLKHAEQALEEDAARWIDGPYEGRATMVPISTFFGRPQWLDEVGRRVVRPLAGLSAVTYYGCLSQRPPAVTGARSPEGPGGMDRLLSALGVQVRPWSYKTDCCGGSLALGRPDLVHKLGGDLLDAAAEAEANCVVTDCPMCQSNLDSRQPQVEVELGTSYSLPVFYLTELIGLALGLPEAGRWWKKHFVDPRPLLAKLGLQ